jgi:hypothetical protein
MHSTPMGLPYTVSNEGAIAYHVSKSVGEDGEEVVIFTAFWETPGRERSAIQPTQRPESQSAPAL